MKIDDILQERAKLVKKAQGIVTLAEGREFTAEERSAYDKIWADVEAMKKQTVEMEADEQRRKTLAVAVADLEKPINRAIVPDIETRAGSPAERPEVRKAFRSLLSATDAQSLYGAMTEMRALQMDLPASGGYTVAPQVWINDLIAAKKALTVFRGLAKTYSVPNAESLGAPSLEANPADPTWTAEIAVGSEDSTMAFGKRELTPHPEAQYIKVSKKLVRASGLGIDALVRDRLAYKQAIVEENCFLNGTGTGQPLGVFTASASGIPVTTYDVSTGNTDTEIRADGLIEAKYTLRSAYWPNSRWLFQQEAIKQIRKLKGNDGDFLWKAGLSNDRGDTILDVPVVVSEYCPHVFTTGLYVGIIGDFSYYWIADALNTEIQVLTELYAATNQNGYIIRSETDGMPVLAEAFVRVTLA